MLNKFLKTWFNFSRRERKGLLLLWIIIFIIAILPFGWNYFFTEHPTDFTAIQKMAAQLDSPAVHAHNIISRPIAKMNTNAVALFYFDPNTVSDNDWKKLGLSQKVIFTIEHYKNKGGHFYKKEDLQKIYGLSAADYVRLKNYVQIKAAGNNFQNKQFVFTKSFTDSAGKTKKLLIEINSADTTQLIRLRGIGSKLANRIISFRSKLGGFYSLDQLREVYALPDSTIQQIKPFLTLDNRKITMININTADVKTLQQHPYIRYALANAIVNYRAQHGAFKSIAGLQDIALVNDEIYRKIAPYIVAN